MKYRDFSKILEHDDAEQLQERLDAGLDPNLILVGESLLYRVVAANKPRMLKTLLCAGADMSTGGDAHPSPVLYHAITRSSPEMMRGLLRYGAETKMPGPDQGTLLHALADRRYINRRAGTIADRLVLERVDVHAERNGYTAREKARGKLATLARQLEAYEAVVTAVEDGAVTRAMITEPTRVGRNHVVWGDLPGTWGYGAQILAQLEARGEALTHADMTHAGGPDEMPRAGWMVVARQFDALQNHLQQHGQPMIGMTDFVRPDGQAKPLLAGICREWAEDRLLETDWFRQLDAFDTTRLFRAMSPEAQERIPNKHQLIASKSMRQNSDIRGRE